MVFELSQRGAFVLTASFDCPYNVSFVSVMLSAEEDDGAWALLGTDEGADSQVHLLQLHGTESFSVLPVARWTLPGGVSSIATLSSSRLRFVAACSSVGGVFALDHSETLSPRRQWPVREQRRSSQIDIAKPIIPDQGMALFVSSHADLLVTVNLVGHVCIYRGCLGNSLSIIQELDLDSDVIGVHCEPNSNGVDFVFCSWAGSVFVVDESGEMLKFERQGPARIQDFCCVTSATKALICLQKETLGRVLAFDLSVATLLGSCVSQGEVMRCTGASQPSQVDELESMMALDSAWRVFSAGRMVGNVA